MYDYHTLCKYNVLNDMISIKTQPHDTILYDLILYDIVSFIFHLLYDYDIYCIILLRFSYHIIMKNIKETIKKNQVMNEYS